MQVQTRNIWIGLMIAIGFGLMIEVLKSTHALQDGSTWRPRFFGIQDFDDDSVATDLKRRNLQAKRARSRLGTTRIAGLSAPSSEIASTVTSAATSLVAAANPPVPNLTPLKLKATDTSKKKKKKKKEKAVAATQETPVFQLANAESGKTTTSKESEFTGGNSGSRGSGNRTRTIVIGGALNTENPETLEQWLTYILPEPNYERTLKLIQGHDSHAVDSEIFHEVISQMLDDSRVKMHEYAIYALGTSPSLKSFLLLEIANQNEPDGSPLKIQSRTALRAYAKVENLRYLASVISGTVESTSAYEALRLIQIAIVEYKPKSTTPAKAPSASAVAVSRQFTSLLPILTRVTQNSTDASLRQEAATTLRQIQTVLGTPSTPTA